MTVPYDWFSEATRLKNALAQRHQELEKLRAENATLKREHGSAIANMHATIAEAKKKDEEIFRQEWVISSLNVEIEELKAPPRPPRPKRKKHGRKKSITFVTAGTLCRRETLADHLL